VNIISKGILVFAVLEVAGGPNIATQTVGRNIVVGVLVVRTVPGTGWGNVGLLDCWATLGFDRH